MKIQKVKFGGFSLIEAIVALITAVMAIVAVFAIYDRVRRASDSINQNLAKASLPAEILQKIAEDIDIIAGPGSNAQITIANSFQRGLPTAQLTITSRTQDKDGKPQILEQVVWLTDYDAPTGRLILYRSHSGLIWEDNLLDKEQREDWRPDRQFFVPICTGISFFSIQVPPQQDISQKTDEFGRPRSPQDMRNIQRPNIEEPNFIDVWNQPQLPPAITVKISFAEPAETAGGSAQVDEQQKMVRTIAIDRSKKVNFVYIPLSQRDANFPYDPNNPRAAQDADMNDRRSTSRGIR